MVAIQSPILALSALLLALLAVTVSAAPASSLERRGYAAFDGFSRVVNKDSLPWYKPYAATGANMAVVNTPVGYKCFNGQSALLPYVSDWKSFDTLWSINIPLLSAKNSAANNAIIRQKILQIASETNSSGQLTVGCTGDNNVNCGIMQAAPGSVSFNPSNPSASIDQMIRNGVLGTPGSWPNGGPGFAWLFDGAGGQAWFGIGGGGKPYRALRAYNTGKVPNQGNLDATGGAGTVSYVNDIANRLIGWNGRNRGCGY
ncbi:hypothetical protein SLS56_006049 [Neofusicoccum ribis]|uniref:Uncharacterized protein n=1 Tax=Neofusicoccum ribis TaxID=45134 RepID=A0ABR3SS07_9PEZI